MRYHIYLVNLPEDIQTKIHRGEISYAKARALVKLTRDTDTTAVVSVKGLKKGSKPASRTTQYFDEIRILAKDEGLKDAPSMSKAAARAHRPLDAKAIFTNQFGEPVTPKSVQLYWTRHLEKLGIIAREKNGTTGTRYGKNCHEMRDVFRSMWTKSSVKGVVAEFLMGHTVDPLFYNKAYRDEDWMEEQYRQALPVLQIMSDDTPFGKVDGKLVKRLQDQIADLQAQIEMLRPHKENVEERLAFLEKAEKLRG